MSGGSLGRLEELLAATLEQPAGSRAKYLECECPDDEVLRREVADLVDLHDRAADFFATMAEDIAVAAALEIESAARPRICIGPYRTLEAIGHGGMGAVYLAERVDGAFDRKVALKLLHRDMETPQLTARFLAERQLLARLSHPNIAHLLDGGVTEEGRPYFVMEVVEGVPINRYCLSGGLTVVEILRLFLGVIDAVSYLHRNLVVHRDLKPSNILVDPSGQPKLLDFGIAKLLAGEPETAGVTRTGELLMTPEYAAPEQLRGEPVTTATDVYALGAVLYELLTGRRLHERSAADPRSNSEPLPSTPNAALRSRHRSPGPAPGAGSGGGPGPGATPSWRKVPDDLDTICLMALRPEPEARYQSAEQLGQDIERHLAGLPVRARRSTLAYRLGKFARRQRRPLAAALGLVVLAAAGFLRERSLRTEAEDARADAQLEAAKATAVSGFLGELLSSESPLQAQGRDVTVAGVLEQAAGKIDGSDELRRQPSVEAAIRRTIGVTYVALGKFPEAKEHLERAVELLGGVDAQDPEAVATVAELGVLYSRMGRYEEAESILRRVIEVQVETHGEDHPATLTALNQLADLLWFQSRYDELEVIDRRTLEIRRRVLGDDHPDTLKSLNGLAGTLFTRGRYAEAAELYTQALAAARRQLGEHHPHTLTLRSNLAAAYTELARYPEAELLLRQVAEARLRVLGAEHPETAVTEHNLGVTLAQEARYPEAEEHLRRAIAIREQLPGADRDLLFSRSYLADVYREVGRDVEAEALYLATLTDQREKLGDEDGDTLKTAAGLAELWVRQARADEAERLLAPLLEVQVRVRGEGHPDALQSLTTLARIRNQQGRYDEAAAFAERAVVAGGESLGPDHPAVLEALLEQARALIGRDRLKDARKLATRIYQGRLTLLGQAHPKTFEAAELLSLIDGSAAD